MSAQLSRRAVLASAAAGVAAVGTVAAQAADRSLQVSHDPALHAARRLSFGATPDLVAHIRSIGLSAWLDEQLTTNPDVHATLASPASALPLPAIALSQMSAGQPMAQLKTATLANAIWGDHQLFEVLVELFSNHLSIYGDGVGPLKVVDDREVIRKNALGTFTDMLLASCQSPAMLRYLNNDVSAGASPNENYARELMELHTVGPHAGYTPAMVHDAARALTGLTIDSTQQFTFKASWHYVGPVRVLGWSHPNNDASKGLDVATSLVRYLASHPSTAKQIATKLVRRFVGDPVPASLVASTAQTYLASGTAIVPTVRHVLLSAEFARSFGRKTQRPFEWVTAAARSLGLQQDPSMLTGNATVVPMMQRLGQAPFEWVKPDGYPDTTQAWTTTASLLARWNTAQQLVNGGIAGFKPLDTATLIGTPVPTTAGALADRLVQRILCQSARPALRSALLNGIGCAAGRTIDQATAQSLTPPLAALILCSPEAMVR